MGLSVVALLFHERPGLFPHGPPQANAMVLPALALFHGHALYSVVFPAAVGPASPGPAWILLNSPFALLHLYWLMLPLWMALAALVFRYGYRRGLELNLGLALILCSPHFYIELAQGEDLVAFCVAVLLVLALADRFLVRADTNVPARWAPGAALLIGVLAGVVATARIIYLPLPLLVGIFVWRRNRPDAMAVGIVGVGVALAANLAAAVGTHPYPPAHLFARSQREPSVNIAIGVIVTVAVIVVMLWRRRTGIVNWLGWTAACITIPHAFIGFGELEGTHFAYGIWEGANYLFVGAVLVVAAVLAERAQSGTRQWA